MFLVSDKLLFYKHMQVSQLQEVSLQVFLNFILDSEDLFC